MLYEVITPIGLVPAVACDNSGQARCDLEAGVDQLSGVLLGDSLQTSRGHSQPGRASVLASWQMGPVSVTQQGVAQAGQWGPAN